MLSIKLEAYRIHSQFHTFLRDVSLSRWTVHHCSGDLCVGTVVHSHRYPHPFRDSWAHEMGEDPNGTRCRERSQLLSYMVFVRMAVFLFLECQWSYSPPAAGRSWILEHCVCTYRQSLLRRTSAGELKEITDCDTSFSWKCYVNVFFFNQKGYPTSFPQQKTGKKVSSISQSGSLMVLYVDFVIVSTTNASSKLAGGQLILVWWKRWGTSKQRLILQLK